jgi:small-conductance mechanosensitive channel
MHDWLDYSDQLLEVFAVPVGESLLAALVCIVVYALLCRGIRRLTSKGFLDDQLRVILGTIIKWLLVAIVILLTLGFFGVSVHTLWAALSGILALVALGFVAVWSVLSNVLCSILLVIFAPFRVGDDIEIQEPTASFSLRGRVTGMNMLFTTLELDGNDEASDKEIMHVPNNIFFQKYVRCKPGRRTQSLKKYLASQHQQNVD